MPPFDPLFFLTVLVAILLGYLGSFVAGLLGLPEWRWPQEYIRSEYESSEFCMYIFRWALDSYDTAFLFFGLLGTLIERTLEFYRYCQRSRNEREVLAGEKPVTISEATAVQDVQDREDARVSLSPEELDDVMGGMLEKILNGAAGKVEGMGSVAVEKFDRFQTRLNDSETRHRDDQENIKQLLDANNALESQKSDLEMRVDAQQETISSIENANTALQSQNTSLETNLSTEQKARRQDAEQALREKEDAVRAAEQQQEERSSKLAGERIKQLQEKHKLELDVQLEQVELASRETTAEKDCNSAIEREKTDLKKKLDKERTSKAGLVKDMEEIRGEGKAARDECTKAKKRQQELEQEFKEARERDKLSKEQHESECKALEGKFVTVESEKEVLQGGLKTAEDELSELKQQSGASAEEAAEQAKQLKQAHQLEVEALDDNMNSIYSEMTGFREQSEALQVRLETTLSENEDLKGDQELASVLRSHVEQRLASTEAILKKCETDLETTLSENKHLKGEHELASVLTSHAEQRLASTAAILKNCQSDLETEMSKNERLEIESTAMRVQNCAVHEELGRIKVTNENLTDQPERHQQAYDALQDELDDAISHATAANGELGARVQELELELQDKDQEIFSGQKNHQEALEAKDTERAKHVSSQDAKIAELEKSIEEARGSLFKQDNEFKDLRARLEAAEKESQDFKEQLRHASMERDELRQQQSTNVEGTNHVGTIERLSSDTQPDAQPAAELAQDGEVATGVALEEAHAAAAEEQFDDEEAEEDDDDNASATQSLLNNDGEEDSGNDDSGDLDESTPAEKLKRKARNRAGNGGKLKKAMTAWNSGESIDGMALTDQQNTVIARTQARALRDSQRERSNQPISWFENCRNQQQQTTPQVVAANTSQSDVVQTQATLVPSANEAEPASSPTSLQPQAALVATAIEFQPAANLTPVQPQSALAATADELMFDPEAVQPPQQRTAGLTGESQHQPSEQTLQPPQQRIMGLTGSQHAPSGEILQPPQPRVQGLSGHKSRWA